MLLTDTQHEMPRPMKQRILHAYSVNNRRLIGSITSTTRQLQQPKTTSNLRTRNNAMTKQTTLTSNPPVHHNWISSPLDNKKSGKRANLLTPQTQRLSWSLVKLATAITFAVPTMPVLPTARSNNPQQNREIRAKGDVAVHRLAGSQRLIYYRTV